MEIVYLDFTRSCGPVRIRCGDHRTCFSFVYDNVVLVVDGALRTCFSFVYEKVVLDANRPPRICSIFVYENIVLVCC